MPDQEPTLGEVTRRLEDVSKRLDDVSHRVENGVTVYVLKQVHDVQMDAHRQRIEDLEKARESDGAFRRQVSLALALLMLSSMVSIALWVATQVSR